MTTSTEQHQVLISTDGHCGADTSDYKPYLEHRYHEAFDSWARDFRDVWVEMEEHLPSQFRTGTTSANMELNWDSGMRLEHIDQQGIAAEVLFPNTAPPFYPSGALTVPGPRSREEYELRFAGLRAHNRWLVDFCNDAPERRAGFAQIFLDDIDEAIAEVRWAKEAGLRGVLLPSDHVLKMANLYYPHYDPLWAVCAELELPVHRHAIFPTESVDDGGKASVLVGMSEVEFYEMRGIGHMLLAGVFERHPNLVFVTTELTNASLIPPYLERLDALVKRRSGARDEMPLSEQTKDAIAELRRTPSEYFATNCYVAGPVHDLRPAYELGTPNLMWGADVPHSEGTSPYSLAAIRTQLWNLPASELNVLLATRAAKIYNLDLDYLQTLADRIGPTIDQIKTPLSDDERPKLFEDTFCLVFSENRSMALKELQGA